MSSKIWPTARLSTLTSKIGDGLHGTPVYTDSSGYPFINGNNLKNGKIVVTADTKKVSKQEFEKYYIELDENTLLLSINGTLGSLAKYNNEDVILGKSAAYIKCNSIDVDFLYYYLQLKEVQDLMWNQATGSTIKNLSLASIKNLEIPLPPGNTAKNISAVLRALDDKIEINNRINAELEAMAKTLYDYWFVQFDYPDANGKPYKSSGGKMVYNPTLKREIPEGWDVGKLGQYLSFRRGISYTSQDIKNTGIPLINLNSFTLAGKFKYEGTKYFNGKYKAENLLSPGELVIAITDVTRNADIIGKAFVIPNIFQTKPLISCDVASVSSARFGNSYLEQLFNSTHYHEYIKHFASGTLVLHLDLNGVNWFKSFIPPAELLARYEAACEQLLKQRDIVIKENLLLDQIRDWLLPMLMNGQVTVK